MIPKEDYEHIFDYMPGIHLILAPNPPRFTILDFNMERAKATNSTKRTAIGKDLFQRFPDNPNDPYATGVRNLTASLMKVMQTKMPHKMSIQKYDIPIFGTNEFELRYWSPENIPVLDNNGEIKYIIHTAIDVTKQILLEEKEKIAQLEITKLSLILSKTHNSVVLADANERIQWVNEAFYDMLELTTDEVRDKSFPDFLLSISNSESHEVIKDSISLRQPRECEIETTTRNGKWICAKLEIQPLIDTSGQLSAFFAIATDISGIKIAEATILKNEQRNRYILGNLSEGIILLDKSGIPTEINSAVARILEVDPVELIGRKRTDLIHPDDLPSVRKAINDALTTSGQQTTSARFRLSGGQYKWIDGTLHNFLNEPSINSFVLTLRDISERMKHEDRLKRSEENYKYLFDNNPAAIFIWDPDTFDVVECNKTAQTLTGYTKEELQSMKVFDYRPKYEHDNIINVSEGIKQGTAVASISPSQIINKSGETLYTDNSYHGIKFYDRDLVLALIVNVTEKVVLERQIEIEKIKKHDDVTDAVLTAQENERAHLGRELHDNINQILTTARLYIEYALFEEKMRIPLMEKSRDFIVTAINEVRGLTKTLVPTALDQNGLKHAINDLVETVQLVNPIRIRSVFNFNEDQLSDKLSLSIFRILQEQLNNIAKHSHASEAKIAITEEDSAITLLISDNGVGFDPNKKHGGLGLKNIISRATIHKGSVSISAMPDAGCEVKVRFVI